MVELGVNLNNRETLLSNDYTLEEMFEIATEAEELEYSSVWVGDSLLEKPRPEPISCLSTVAGKTETVDLGTACMLTPLRNPIQFAQEWATLDMISGGRTIVGACMGAASSGLAKKQYEAVGIPPRKRPLVLREQIEIVKTLWKEGSVTYSGDYFEFEDVTFDTGNEVNQLEPVQDEVPFWVISNPSSQGNDAVHGPAVKRIVDVGDGWMTCCRANHPDEYEAQIAAIKSYADEQGVDMDDIDTCYQVTLNISDSKEEARKDMNDYLGSYYPSRHGGNLEEWGPIGDAQEVIDWIQQFDELGCEHFVLRFGATDQREQMRRFAEEVLPSFR